MATPKRARQKAGHSARLAAARAAQKRRGRQRRFTIVVGLILLVALVAGVGAALVNDEDDTASPTSSNSVPTVPTQPTISPADLLAEPGAEITGETPCPPADASAERTTKFANPPPICIDPDEKYAAIITTTEGEIVVRLDQAAAPASANNFIVLSRYHYYDDSSFFRIEPGFVVQTGDPVGDNPETPEPDLAPGAGNPGYEFDDDVPADISAYTTGSVAMANSGPGGSNGSQWFIYTGPDDGSAMAAGGPIYPRFGEVVGRGLEVARGMERYLDPTTGGLTTAVKVVAIEILEGERAVEAVYRAAAAAVTTTVPATGPPSTSAPEG